MENEEMMTNVVVEPKEAVAESDTEESESTSTAAMAGGIALIGFACYGAYKLATGVVIPVGKKLVRCAKSVFTKKENATVFDDECIEEIDPDAGN